MFRDRIDAGRQLAALLRRDPSLGDSPVVLALPRGGVPVGREVAAALGVPLEVLCVRKLGAPEQPELGLGAVAEGGAVWVDPRLCAALGVGNATLARIREREEAELARRVRKYRGERRLPRLTGRTVILVDDGVATGGTARAALRAVADQRPAKLVFAAPVIAAQTYPALERDADEVVAVDIPEDLGAIGAFYDSFEQLTDEEVIEALRQPAALPLRQVEIRAGGAHLVGDLRLPDAPRGLVIFAHGSGSSRKSPRNRAVAEQLGEAGLATLLFDLLTTAEEAAEARGAQKRFDVELLATRLAAAIAWARGDAEVARLPIGCFGASTGAAAALIAAAAHPAEVRAVVSRGGRPDLAARALGRVRAPTLLIVGGDDTEVLALNEQALAALPGEKDLAIVPGATHLFEEPGALAEVARLAAEWFIDHLAPQPETALSPG